MAKGPVPILYISSRSAIGGGEVWLLRLLGRLNRERFSPSVLCPAGPLAHKVEGLGIPVVEAKAAHLRSPFDVWKIFWLLRDTCQKGKVQLIHSCGLNVFASFFSQLFSIPEIVHIHTARPFGGWVRWHLNRARRLIAVSEYAKKILTECGIEPGRIRVIQNGLESLPFEKARPLPLRETLGLDPDTLLAGVVGQLTPGKGIETFLEAAALLREQGHGSIRFLIAGEAPPAEAGAVAYKRRLEERVKELRLEEAVHFTGFVEDVPSLMKTLDILVLSSELPEGSSLCSLEAMAASRPVVATRVGAVPEIVSDNDTGILVPPTDPEALSKALLRLVSDPRLRREMGERGFRKMGPSFSLTEHVHRTEGLYEQVLHSG